MGLTCMSKAMKYLIFNFLKRLYFSSKHGKKRTRAVDAAVAAAIDQIAGTSENPKKSKKIGKN